jgi:DNA-binding transcriptional ArsR family regulator
MLTGQDILVLLRLMMPAASQTTIRELDEPLQIGPSAVHRSLGSLREAGLVDSSRRINAAQVDEFLSHSSRYLFPPRSGGETRGIPTAWAAAPLRGAVAESGLPPVWPHPRGSSRGISMAPIHKAGPDAALRSPELYELLVILDGLRMSDARIRELARRELRESLAVAV